jgi:hypothetical protein
VISAAAIAGPERVLHNRPRLPAARATPAAAAAIAFKFTASDSGFVSSDCATEINPAPSRLGGHGLMTRARLDRVRPTEAGLDLNRPVPGGPAGRHGRRSEERDSDRAAHLGRSESTVTSTALELDRDSDSGGRRGATATAATPESCLRELS